MVKWIQNLRDATEFVMNILQNCAVPPPTRGHEDEERGREGGRAALPSPPSSVLRYLRPPAPARAPPQLRLILPPSSGRPSSGESWWVTLVGTQSENAKMPGRRDVSFFKACRCDVIPWYVKGFLSLVFLRKYFLPTLGESKDKKEA